MRLTEAWCNNYGATRCDTIPQHMARSECLKRRHTNMCEYNGCMSRISNKWVPIAGENVPEEEQQSSKDQRSGEPYDNTPIIDNLLPAGGGVSVSGDERRKYEEDVRNLYKQLDDKVSNRTRLKLVYCKHVTYSYLRMGFIHLLSGTKCSSSSPFLLIGCPS